MARNAEREDHKAIHRDDAEEREAFSCFVLHCCDIGAQTFPTAIASKVRYLQSNHPTPVP